MSSYPQRALSPFVQRLFTGSGTLPLAAFLLGHLALNAFAVRGVVPFARVVGVIHRVPALGVLETLFVFAPLALHGALGLWLMVTRQSLEPARRYPTGLRTTMRVTGAVVFAFLLLHLPEFRWHSTGERLDGPALATLLARNMSSTYGGLPWRGAAYLLGTACAVFHLGAGLWALFASSRRGCARPEERKRAAWAIGAVSGAIWLVFVNVVVFHATGAALFGGGPSEVQAGPTGKCP